MELIPRQYHSHCVHLHSSHLLHASHGGRHGPGLVLVLVLPIFPIPLLGQKIEHGESGTWCGRSRINIASRNIVCSSRRFKKNMIVAVVNVPFSLLKFLKSADSFCDIWCGTFVIVAFGGDRALHDTLDVSGAGGRP